MTSQKDAAVRLLIGKLFRLATHRWLLRYGLFFLIWLIGTLGFKAAIDGGTFGDSAYRALQTFALNYEAPQDAAFHAGPALELVRFLAAGFAVFALISLISRQFSGWIRRMCQQARGKQIVLLGFGEVNRLVLAGLVDKDVDVLVVDKVFHEADYAAARAGGYLLYERDLADRTTFDDLSLGRARRVYIACGSDALNLKVGSQAARTVVDWHKRHNGPGTIPSKHPTKPGFDKDYQAIVQVHISSPRFMLDLSTAEDHSQHLGIGKAFFSLKVATARVLTDRARFVRRARDLGQARPHIVIVGGGEMAEAILCDVLHRCVSDAGQPRISILDPLGTALKQRFAARYPQLFDDSLPTEARPEVAFETCDVTTLNFDHAPLLEMLEAQAEPPTAWVFVCREDETNLEASLRLEAAMHMGRRRHVPVFKRIWQGDAVPLNAPENFGTSELFGQRDDVNLRRAMISTETDQWARAIHQTYGFDKKAVELAQANATTGGIHSAPFTLHWVNLPQNVRRSNEMAAAFLPQKLRDLGFNWRRADTGILPRFEHAPPVATLLAQMRSAGPQAALPAELIPVAKAEHTRWMIDRALAGWAHNKVRSNRRHLHYDMVAFADLDDATRKLDLTSLSVALGAPAMDEAGQRPVAYPVAEAHHDIRAVQNVTPAKGTTDLILSLDPAAGRLSAADLKAATAFVAAFGALPSACRVLFRVVGLGDFKVARPAPKGTGYPPEDRRELRSLLEWFSDATAKLPDDVLVDVTYLPDDG